MTTFPYIILQDSSGSGGSFAVVQGGYKPVLERNQTMVRTSGGNTDVAQGGIFERHEYLIRCREDEERSGYGNIHELERLWKLNSPYGSPTDKITFTDHFGNQHIAIFLGEFSRSAVTTILSGGQAWYMVPVTFLVLQENVGLTLELEPILSTWVYSLNPDEDYGEYEFVYAANTTSYIMNGMIKHNLAPLPVEAVVKSVTLRIYYNTVGPGTSISIHRILAANEGWNGNSTWNHKAPPSTAWAGLAGCSNPGTDYSSTAMATFAVSSDPSVPKQYLVPLNLAEFELMRASNQGVIIRDPTQDDIYPHAFLNHNYELTSLWPKLIVVIEG
jgi:hypothetical protein